MDVKSDLNFGSAARILNLPNAASAQEPATKAQLDAAIEGLKNKDPVRVATSSNVNLASPGATLDGVSMASGDRFMARGQSTTAQNGLYVWNGAASAATRTTDASTAAELNNAIVHVTEGTDAGKDFRQTATVVTLDTDTVTWTSFGSGASAATESSPGIAEIATQAETDTGTDDARFLTPLKAKSASWMLRKFSALIGDGSATQYDVTHNFNTTQVTIAVFYESDGIEIMCDRRRFSANTVRLNFAVAPASDQFRVVIIG
jgi:hypothetical protein